MYIVCLRVFVAAYVYCREIHAYDQVECLLIYLHDRACVRVCVCVCVCVYRHMEHIELLNALMEETRWLKATSGASLVAQWLGVRLPMQGTRVRAPIWEDPTCRGATKPVRHNC